LTTEIVGMERLEKLNIEVPKEISDIVDEAVASGQFSSAGEVVSSALSEWKVARSFGEYSLDELRTLVAEGEESGEPIDGEGAFRRVVTNIRTSATGQRSI